MVVTRFAPSPTGRLHLGHAYSALTAWRFARERFLLKIETARRDGTLETPQRPRASEACILWPGYLDNGYGGMRLVSTPDMHIRCHILAARMFLLDSDPIPEGFQINHTCDVRQCVNYRHLYIGDHNMNSADLRHRGSFARQMAQERQLYHGIGAEKYSNALQERG